jgi:hypothetical protein
VERELALFQWGLIPSWSKEAKSQPQSSSTMPDQFQYEMTIEDVGRTHTLRISDDRASDDLKLLFDFLAEEALRRLKHR